MQQQVVPRDVIVEGRIMRVLYEACWRDGVCQDDGYRLVRDGYLALHSIPKHRGQFVFLDEFENVRQQLKEGAITFPKTDKYKADAELRDAVIARDHTMCRYCGADLSRLSWKICVDHILPYMRRGTTTIDNLVTACRSCNQKKGNRTPEEAGMKLMPLEGVMPNAE